MLSLLVSIWFQVLFHSPPGVLFTFPSRYYTLSVTRSYLALGDGPPFFPPDSSCPVVLRIPARLGSVSLTRLLLSLTHLSRWFCYQSLPFRRSLPSLYLYNKFGLLPVRSPLLRKSLVYFLFLRVVRCFSSPGSPYYTMYLCNNTAPSMRWVPSFGNLRISSFATPRSLSQLITSFFGA